MTLGQKVVAIAAAQIGVRESGGANLGPPTKYQEPWRDVVGYVGWPWCAAFVSWCWFQAGLTVEAFTVAHPSTALMCQRATQRHLFSDPVPGAAIIWCGTHTGLVAAVGDGIVHTIEGNTSDMVARRVRSTSGARFIVPPALLAEPPKPPTYWLEDLAARPRLVGPWRSKAARDRKLESLRPETRRMASPVTTGDDRYGIRLGPRRHYGPWLEESGRDRARKVLEDRLGRRLRPYRKGAAPVTGAAEDLGKTD